MTRRYIKLHIFGTSKKVKLLGENLRLNKIPDIFNILQKFHMKASQQDYAIFDGVIDLKKEHQSSEAIDKIFHFIEEVELSYSISSAGFFKSLFLFIFNRQKAVNK